MTIHADWIHQFKSWAPDAFTSDIPQPPVAGFIDGQIKLMGMPRPETGVPTWDLFLKAQFITPIQHMWRCGIPLPADVHTCMATRYRDLVRTYLIFLAPGACRISPVATHCFPPDTPFRPILSRVILGRTRAISAPHAPFYPMQPLSRLRSLLQPVQSLAISLQPARTPPAVAELAP